MSGWASRPLGDAARRRTFIAAAGVLTVSAIGLAMLGPAPQRPQRAAQDGAPEVLTTPSVTAITTTTVAAPTPTPPLAVADQRATLRAARGFLRAYLRFEVADHAAAVRRALRRTATGAFASDLLANPPRTAGVRPHAGRVDGLELADDATAADVSVSATIDRAGEVTPLTVRLAREDGRWLVSGLG